MDAAESEDLAALLCEIADLTRDEDGGALASYIPELANVEADRFAIAICTTDGQLISAGDVDQRFTLQSTCKPFLYGEALARLGRRTVRSHVGVEPTGEEFDSLVRLEAGRHRAHNPMVNTGAIAIAGLLAGSGYLPDRAAVLDLLSAFGGSVAADALAAVPAFDGAVYDSELATAFRNRAIAHLLRAFDLIEVPAELALERYFDACSTLVTTPRLAVMAATLAGGGVLPGAIGPAARPRGRVLPRRVAADVLAVMSTCGMYDAAGHFAFDLGLPAKSGVSGAIIAVVPDRFGVAVFSPRIDAHGTSVRGQRALALLASRLRLHPFEAPSAVAAAPRSARPTAPLAAPTTSTLRATLRAVHARREHYGRGHVATYAPGLANANPDDLTIAICTVDGRELVVGRGTQRVSLQAVANPFSYAIALELCGQPAVHAAVGVEPSGNTADTIELDPLRARPFNPLENTGAITVAGLLAEAGLDGPALLDRMSAFAGEPLRIDEAMLAAEYRAASRNRAIANLLRAAGVLAETEPALELYLRQCSIAIPVPAVARMAALLAAHGQRPGGPRLTSEQTARDVLAVMYSAGMHHASGEFAVEVGLPAKSGISGCIAAVVPGRLGIAVYSPLLDSRGVSVRGLAVLRDLSRTLDLGIFTPGATARTR
ncbi:MAG: glutaminase A [Chloroflexi bacterium]|nr:glutaminase A [Chloroflexota bacterium]MDA1147885.1 glutaminase A [Chloroflexota bacterium]MQC25549.1 glutaminase A [Chloroflexota bacterium]MQC83173.1 glutaminase A [Chloroflexota bacterium]